MKVFLNKFASNEKESKTNVKKELIELNELKKTFFEFKLNELPEFKFERLFKSLKRTFKTLAKIGNAIVIHKP